jgi:hypothetical protein
MVSVFDSSAVDYGFEPHSGQTKFYSSTNNQNLLQNSDKADSLSIPYPLVSPKFHLVDMSSLLRLLNRSEIMSK